MLKISRWNFVNKNFKNILKLGTHLYKLT